MNNTENAVTLTKFDKFKNVVKMLFNDLFKTPFYLLTHPLKGFEEFKTEGLRKKYVAFFYLFMMALTQVIAYNGRGFLVNTSNADNFNAFRIILLVIVPVVLVTIGNWAFTTLFDGKGNMEEIFSVITYSFAPFVWIALPNILFSNYIIAEEVGFYFAFNTIGIVLTGYMIFFGLLVIHEYGFLKSFVTLVFTIVAIGIIIFIVFLVLTIFQQVYSFLGSIIREFIMRYF